MPTTQIVRCPNCGNFAERQHLSNCRHSTGSPIIRTTCTRCDYLMVMGLSTGTVLEAYAPGLPAR